ncbi:high affinity choline transporter 1-like [Haliotis rubra]|uniref:high affinity choline transporter 1-like n=1 Tax=Haliotis rubra TaxID=36100 RepID=UPI001EE54BD5|nr:high affinity choline transporter 1-like [Haliotis rubra]
MAVNIPGLVAVLVFYVIILLVGIVAGRKKRSTNDFILAGRSMNSVVSVFSITVAFVYAPKLHRLGCVTMLDPLQKKYGKFVGGLLFFPELMGDLFWAAAILAALGSTMAILLDVQSWIMILVSGMVAAVYTCVGGLQSVAYTDILQLVFIVIGLVVSFPFAMQHPAVDFSSISSTWTGQVPVNMIGSYIDVCLLLVFGAIPWQLTPTYGEHVAWVPPLTPTNSQHVPWVPPLTPTNGEHVAWVPPLTPTNGQHVAWVPPLTPTNGEHVAWVPPLKPTNDWNQTSYEGAIPLSPEMQSSILPLVLNYLCPLPVSMVGLGAISAAVMSSADSVNLAASSVAAKNIYNDIFRPKASDREVLWVMRISSLIFAGGACALAIVSKSVFGLFVACGDLIYVIQFPQFTCALWASWANGYGSVVGFIVALILRIGAGEPLLNFQPFIRFPLYDEVYGQLFPFRTLIAIISFVTILSISAATNLLFKNRILPASLDVLNPSGRHTKVDTNTPTSTEKNGMKSPSSEEIAL